MQAMALAEGEVWKKAEEDDLRRMRVHGVLKPAKLSEDVVRLNTKWVYTVQTDFDGKITKYKARLVANLSFTSDGYRL